MGDFILSGEADQEAISKDRKLKILSNITPFSFLLHHKSWDTVPQINGNCQFRANRPFPSSPQSLFQRESKCEILLW